MSKDHAATQVVKQIEEGPTTGDTVLPPAVAAPAPQEGPPKEPDGNWRAMTDVRVQEYADNLRAYAHALRTLALRSRSGVVTAAMIEAAYDAFPIDIEPNADEAYTGIYRAMLAARPKE